MGMLSSFGTTHHQHCGLSVCVHTSRSSIGGITSVRFTNAAGTDDCGVTSVTPSPPISAVRPASIEAQVVTVSVQSPGIMAQVIHVFACLGLLSPNEHRVALFYQ